MARQVISHTSGWVECIVVNVEGVVAGRVRAEQLDNDPDIVVVDVMERGPTTIRPDDDLDTARQRMTKRNVESMVVTDPSGRLIGTLRLQDSAQNRSEDAS